MWRGVKKMAAAVALALSLALGADAGAQSVKRLILTDGSYQMATEWKKAGDRVKYFSAERGDWEELPASLVNWKATEEWNAAAAKGQDEELKQESGEAVAERKEAELNTPQVAPKLAPELRLPAEGGVFLLEERAGKAVLQEVPGDLPLEKDHAARLGNPAVPTTEQRQTMELKGAAAKVRIHAAALSIFVDVENGRGVIGGSDFRIVRLERKKNLRVAAGAGSEGMFPQLRAEKFSGDWWKLIPQEELRPGEYAIVIEGAAGEDNGLVWDFGVDP